MLTLVEPSQVYKDTFLQGVHELQAEGRLLYYDLDFITDDFDAFLQHSRNQKDRMLIDPGRVPASEFWLIDNDEFVGFLSLRHELNDFLKRIGGHIGYMIRPSKRRQGYGKQILRLGLEKARALGLRRALVTCDEDNIGSKKIIEYNGGKFENAIEVEGEPRKLRYWIDID